MSRPKGHMSSAGIVPVFLNAEHVWILHRYAAALNLPVQDAAAHLLTIALNLWNHEHPEPTPPQAA